MKTSSIRRQIYGFKNHSEPQTSKMACWKASQSLKEAAKRKWHIEHRGTITEVIGDLSSWKESKIVIQTSSKCLKKKNCSSRILTKISSKMKVK